MKNQNYKFRKLFIKIIFGLTALLVISVGSSLAATYRLSIDCNHSAISATETGNRITVSFLDRNRNVIRRMYRNGIRNCAALDKTFSFETNRTVRYVVFSTNGNDAFYIDEWRLYLNGTLIKHEGRDNGRGWCLSTDPNDAAGAWSGYVTGGCRSSIRFSVFAGNPPPTRYSYRLTIDCNHNAISATDTRNRITVSFLGRNGRLIRNVSRNGVGNCANSEGIFTLTTNQQVGYVLFRTNGNDAFFIDEWRLSLNGRLIKHEGRDNGRGWCLSTDPNDTAGWRNYLTGACKSRLRFSVSSSVTPPPTSTNYRLAMDCNHPSVSSRETTNRITVRFLDGNRRIIRSVFRNGINNCSSGNINFNINTNRSIRYVELLTNGNDAFYVDQWFLYRNNRLIKRQGSNNERGWCLSTDPADSRGWSGYLVGTCQTRIRFPITNISSPPPNSAVYRLLVDCTHPSVSARQTANRITALFLDGTGNVIRSVSKNGITNCSSGNSIFSFNSNRIVKYVELRTNGNDAFYIDQWRLYRNGVYVGGAGSNGGKGWCLSTDPNDTNGWRNYLTVGCLQRLRSNRL